MIRRVIYASLLKRMTINHSLIAIQRALVRSLQYHVVIARSLARSRYHEKCIIVVCSLQYNIKIRSLCVIAHDAMVVACICAMWQQKMLMLSILAIWQKYALVSDGIKAKWLHKSEATSQRLHVWRAFWPPFFEVRFSRQGWKEVEKIVGSKVKSAVKNRISEILLS